MAAKAPLYNLKAVINEVGINPATLRAWERRYDLLKPRRSPGGHRLYSRQDIEMLKWLIERQNEGLSISSAVEMWKNQQMDFHEISRETQTRVPIGIAGETMLDILREQWLLNCMVFDDLAANQILDQAFAVAAPETIIAEVLQKGLARIGERWYAGTATIQQEHFTTAIAIRRVNALLAATAKPSRAGHILAACPPGEEHDFVLLMISYLLKRDGWEVIYLGSNVPLINLDTTIRSTSPILILSSAQTFKTAASLRNFSEYLVTQGIPMAYGGGIFNRIPAATRCISGYFLGTDISIVPELVKRLVSSPPPMHYGQPISLQYTQTLSKFMQNEAAISLYVSSILQSEPDTSIKLEYANTNLNQLIASALSLGDINLLEESILWLNGLLLTHGISEAWVSDYYTGYRQAVERYLGEDGNIILDQLGKYKYSG